MKISEEKRIVSSLIHHGMSMIAGALYFAALSSMSGCEFITYALGGITMLIGTWFVAEFVSRLLIHLYYLPDSQDEISALD